MREVESTVLPSGGRRSKCAAHPRHRYLSGDSCYSGPDGTAASRQFYSVLLGWELELADDDPDFATVAARDGVAYVGFQTARAYSWSFWSHSRVRAWSRMWTLRS